MANSPINRRKNPYGEINAPIGPRLGERVPANVKRYNKTQDRRVKWDQSENARVDAAFNELDRKRELLAAKRRIGKNKKTEPTSKVGKARPG